VPSGPSWSCQEETPATRRLPADPDQCRPAAVTLAADALQCGAAWWRVEPEPQPVLVDGIDPVGDAAQSVVGAQHAVAAIAEIAAPEQEQLLAGLVVALERRQDRDAGGGGSSWTRARSIGAGAWPGGPGGR
jgi:hypothetical protein